MSWRPPQGTLAQLVSFAKEDCQARRRVRPGLPSEVERSRPSTRGFARALAGPRPGFPLICEVKRASPSVGAIRPEATAPRVAQAYVRGGAACVSVLTEGRRFGGALADLRAVRDAVEVPLLRKDFMVDPYMVYEAAEAGADCILLIAGAVPPSLLGELAQCAQGLGLDVLLELVHPHELEVLASVQTPLVGVNARDLETLAVDPFRLERLGPALRGPGRTLVAESGVRTPADIQQVARWGAGAALVGESLMRAADPEAAVRALTEVI